MVLLLRTLNARRRSCTKASCSRHAGELGTNSIVRRWGLGSSVIIYGLQPIMHDRVDGGKWEAGRMAGYWVNRREFMGLRLRVKQC